MSIKDRALAAAEYAAAEAALEREASRKRAVLQMEHSCKEWIQEHFGAYPEEVVLTYQYGEVSKRVMVRLEDDIWLCWTPDGSYMQSGNLSGNSRGEPVCWFIDLDRNVCKRYNTTEKGLGEGGWDEARVDISLAPRVHDLVSLGAVLARKEKR